MDKNELKNARLNLKLTQQGLSELIGVSREFIGLMESGSKPISLKTELKIKALTNDNKSELNEPQTPYHVGRLKRKNEAEWKGIPVYESSPIRPYMII